MTLFNGLEIRIKPDAAEFYMGKRSWFDRLFTLPWQPFVRTVRVDLPEGVKQNRTVHRMGNCLIMTEAMKKEVLNASKL